MTNFILTDSKIVSQLNAAENAYNTTDYTFVSTSDNERMRKEP